LINFIDYFNHLEIPISIIEDNIIKRTGQKYDGVEFINLCVNARDAMPEGGKLEIKTRNISVDESIKINKKYKLLPKGEYVLLEVIDTGTGIARSIWIKFLSRSLVLKRLVRGLA